MCYKVCVTKIIIPRKIFLTFAPLKANDQDMSLRSSDQNIMKIPTDGFHGIQYNFCIFYISVISFHLTETTTSPSHTNTRRKRNGNNAEDWGPVCSVSRPDQIHDKRYLLMFLGSHVWSVELVLCKNNKIKLAVNCCR